MGTHTLRSSHRNLEPSYSLAHPAAAPVLMTSRSRSAGRPGEEPLLGSAAGHHDSGLPAGAESALHRNAGLGSSFDEEPLHVAEAAKVNNDNDNRGQKNSLDRTAGVTKAAESGPRDKYGLIWIIFLLQGLGMNYPWNVFITAVLYFHVRLESTPFQDNFENIFSLCYSMANLCFMVLVVLLAHRPFFDMRVSVFWPQVFTALIFTATTIMVKMQIEGTVFFAITCTFVLFCGVTAALVQAGIFGLAGRFPSIYTQAVMSGQGIAGIVVSITSLCSALATSCKHAEALPSNETVFPEAFYFFMTSTIVVVLTVMSFLAMNKSDFARHYAFSLELEDQETVNDSSAESNLNPNFQDHEQTVMDVAMASSLEHSSASPGQSMSGSKLGSKKAKKSILSSPVFQKSPTVRAVGSSRSETSTGTNYSEPSVSVVAEDRGENLEALTNVVASPSSFADTMQKNIEGGHYLPDRQIALESKRIPTCKLIYMIGRHCFSVCFVFAVTLSVFPAITSDIRSKSNLKNERCPHAGRFPFGAGIWQALFFLIFNVGDTVGRLLAGLGRPFAAHHVVWVSLSRVIFIPLFLLCNLAAKSRASSSPPSLFSVGFSSELESVNENSHVFTVGFFHEDYWPVLFMALMAISNGWVASLEMMAGPLTVPRDQQSRAGTIMAFFLVLGLVLGSIFSFGVRSIACNCNPFTSSKI